MDKNARIDLKDEDVLPILRQEFVDGAAFAADIFTRIGEHKYVLVARQGDKANFIELHLNEEVDYLYVRRSEFRNCVGQNISIAGILIHQRDISNIKKTTFVAKAAESVFKELAQFNINLELLEHARSVANNIKLLVECKTDFDTVLKVLAKLPGSQMHKAMAVSWVSVMIAKTMGWATPSTHEKLALGGLLLDVGLKELPRDLIEKPRHEMSQEERMIYETHPFRGVEILRSMPSASDELMSIVFEHHENANGQGYPRRLRDIRMNPLAKIVCVADVFCELTIKAVNNPNPRSPEDAITYIELTLGLPYNKPVFLALKQLLGLNHIGRKKKPA